MELILTPEPHFIPGYTGYCPQYRYRIGKSYGHLTHKLLVDPCVRHSPQLLVAGSKEIKPAEDRPTPKEINLLMTHEREVDAVYKFPIVPGYDGFIPNLKSKIGDRFLTASTAGVAEHEQYMQELKCQKRNLIHRDLLQDGRGNFGRNIGERPMQAASYELPLVPVPPEAEDIIQSKDVTDSLKIPYSKDTPPHFMVDDDPDKFIIAGYAGHIPMALNRFGQNNKDLTTSALSEFSNHRRNAESVVMKSTGFGTSLPGTVSFEIYNRTTGMIPNYSGHVPGEIFKFGATYGRNTFNAKHWLDENM